jgi:FkbM family methyltransferase
MGTPAAPQSQARARSAARPQAGTTWATVTTLREPPERVKAFVAQHVFLGALEIWLYFDDPEDPAIALVEAVPQVRVIRCTEAHKAQHSNKAGTHEGRQKANANHAYGLTAADWLIHLDADEMVQADGPVSALLKGVQGDVLRLAPYEALSYAKAGQNGRPDHYFHGALPADRKGRVAAESIYGRFHKAIPQGLLSHTAGKHFVRTGLAGMEMKIHGPMRDGLRASAVETDAARLLHFHGASWEHWRAHLDRRLSSGAYIAKFGKGDGTEDNLYFALQALRDAEGDKGLRAFWKAVCTYGPDKRILRRLGALYRCNLWLDAKIAAVFGGDNRLSSLGHDPDSGAFEAEVRWEGLKLRLFPDNNYTECLIARGEPVESAELQAFRSLVTGRKVLFYDVGGNAGIFSLLVASAAVPASRIIAFEPNPEMQRRFARNVALNGFANIEIRPVALGETRGEAFLSITRAGNLGQASLSDSAEGTGHTVPLRPLPEEMADPSGYELSLMKIDVEGHEPGVLAPLLDPGRKAGHWPDIIMLEHTGAAGWGIDLIAALTARGYAEYIRTAENIFLKRKKTKG